MMAEVTPGWDSTNACANSVMEMPASAATLASSSTTSSLRWLPGLDRSNRRATGDSPNRFP